MKINWNKRYTTYAIYAAIVCAALVFCVFCVVYFQNILGAVAKVIDVLSPIIYGCIIAYIISPIAKFFEKKVYKNIHHGVLRRGVSVFCTLLIFLLIIALLFYAVVPQIVRSFNDLQAKLSLYSSSIQDWLDEVSAQSGVMATIVEKINEVVDLSVITSPLNAIIDVLYDLTAEFSPYIASFLGTFVIHMKNFLIGLVFAVYLLSSKELVFAQINKLLHAFMKKEKILKIRNGVEIVDKTFGKYIKGTLMDAIIVGVITAIVLTICRMPYIPLISVLIACTNIIPIFGPFIGAIPSFIFIFISDPIKALWFIVIILVIQQIDGNIIAPRILGSSTGLPAIVVICAITIMGGLFGIVGMVIGVPVFAVLTKLIIDKTNKKMQKASENADEAAAEAETGTQDALTAEAEPGVAVSSEGNTEEGRKE